MARPVNDQSTFRKESFFFDPGLSRKWVERHRCRFGNYTWNSMEGLLSSENDSLGRLIYPRTRIAGPVEIRFNGDWIRLGKLGGAMYQHSSFHPNRLAFRRCSARGILIVEPQYLAERLAETGFPNHSRLVLVSGGIASLVTRTLLRKLSKELRLPIYLLVPNETLGYFMFSVLRRGAVLPHTRGATRLADVRYIGIRSADRPQGLEHMRIGISEPHIARMQIRCLKRYACFQSPEWRAELDHFEAQMTFAALEAIAAGNIKRLEAYVLRRIAEQDWLS